MEWVSADETRFYEGCDVAFKNDFLCGAKGSLQEGIVSAAERTCLGSFRVILLSTLINGMILHV